ncbi:MAG: DUF5752 family protein [Candidatus Binatia bacterium]
MVEKRSDSPKPFEFWKVAFLVEVTHLRAVSLGQLLTGVTLAPQMSIFYHLHQRFFRDPERLPEYPNDFSAWADTILGDAVAAERLANLNLTRSVDLESVRREISIILAEHLHEISYERHASPGQEFIFCKPRLVGFGSGRRAHTLSDFVEILRDVDSDSIGYHLFTPRITPGRVANDFATWFRQLGHETVAQQLDNFDPYLNSLEDNRAYLLEIIETDTHRPKTRGIHD